VGGKKLLIFLLVLVLAGGGGYYYWTHRSATAPESAAARGPAPNQKLPHGETAAPQAGAPHPKIGETVAHAQPFFESDYGFSMVVPAGWRVVNWTDPAAPEPGKRRPAYKIRLEDPKTGTLLDFACYPFTEKSRTAVEEIFISKIQPPIPGLELDIQMDEVVKEGDMRIRRAELKTRDVKGNAGLMKTYYYLSNDKLYTFSLSGAEQTMTPKDTPLAKVIDDIRILG
jgi:hypothetical protein